ncbi:hypothetical protein RchiOBHm_Chr2g0090571 [Rosa chinensis]|uniref:Uncharacterized protein n=1 Tax=Rosa chinensis TaxID=74649 RepID=A0A2P6RJK7_ROSCH|nr:hypothetical protein RchiOBHm_Chr2g0090571 [Rosa chinensis]
MKARHTFRIAFITFEFQFTANSNDDDEFSFKSLNTGICEYDFSKCHLSCKICWLLSTVTAVFSIP